MTTLLLDVGNSHLKWGVCFGDAIADTGRCSLQDLQRQGAANLETYLPEGIDAAIACNVAGGAVASMLDDFMHSTFGSRIEFVKSSAAAGGVTNAYQDPERLGVDRWVAMIGARAATTAACLVVDAGTAITLDAIDEHGQHLGGQILPGFTLMAATLNGNTSDLPSIEADQWSAASFEPALANSTEEAIVKGIMGAILGSVERAVQSLQEDFAEAIVLLTGGDGGLIHGHLQHAAELRPNLVLEGLACLAKSD